MRRPAPITTLPPDYREVLHLQLMQGSRMVWLQLAAFVPLILALLLMQTWAGLVTQVRGAWPGEPPLPTIILLVLVYLLMMVLHEGLHGLVIAWAGQIPRFGVKWRLGVVYATTDGGYFSRNVFIAIALAPLVGITLLGLVLVWFIPDGWGYWVGWMVVLNAAGAIGDLWMSVVALRYPPTALIRDEAESIRVYVAMPG
jgi:hypothetical protein